MASSPRTQITMTLKTDYEGSGGRGGGRITGSVKYFKSHQDDVGAMIHETVHCVQAYRTRGPGWLVEGIADYVRFFKYEPGKIGRIRADSHFDGSYRTTAAFLNFAAEKYDKQLVKKVNKAMREGEYREEIWKVLTKKTVKELDEEWRASMKKGATVTFDLENSRPGQFIYYDLPMANAEVLAKQFQETYKSKEGFRVVAANPKRIFVWAEPKIHEEIDKFINQGKRKDAEPKKADPSAKAKKPAPLVGEPSLRIYPVAGGHAEAIAKILKDIYATSKVRVETSGSHHLVVWAEPPGPLRHRHTNKATPVGGNRADLA